MCQYNTNTVGQAGTFHVSLIRKVLSRYLVSVCSIRRDYKRKWNDLSELSTGERRTCSFYLWSKRNHWAAGKYTSALTRGSAGSYMALLPAGCSTWSRQERYRNETWGKRNGNDHKNSMRDNTWSVEGKECAHKDEEKKAKSNYLLYQGSHTPPPQKATPMSLVAAVRINASGLLSGLCHAYVTWHHATPLWAIPLDLTVPTHAPNFIETPTDQRWD